MRSRTLSLTEVEQAVKRSLATIKLRPKLKDPSQDALPPDERAVTPTNDPAFKKQIMGFKEWCEKVYEPAHRRSGRELDRSS
jgi:hypothetical protein